MTEPGATEASVASGVLTHVSLGVMTAEDNLRMLDLARQGCARVAASARRSLEKAYFGFQYPTRAD